MTAEVVARLRAAGCVFAEDEAALLVADGRDLGALVDRRVAGEPLEQVLGWVGFCGLRVLLDPGVFVPRQRTALLVEEAVRLGGRVVVDLCCGSGAVGLAVAAGLGDVELGDVELVAADVDPAAVACARRNGVAATAGDLFDALPGQLRGRVDLLCVNAPYVPTDAIADMPPEARDHEPATALDGGADGLDLHRRVAAGARDWLAPGGSLLLETSRRQTPGTLAAVVAGGLTGRVVTDDDRGAAVVVGTRVTPGR
ncbi:release factor glutamine methyltransferase [Klenkia soli]|uniref:peptide chain release factor N(5)-glutamine methyltransferase n=1 Tax=Klenkia soli TaxID=1052260 RepID=A0A1H0NAB6_9ACTN|nr:putative protein N(5)-glutamine methyltransferase [Klenkia soli]SDO89684.1 release factor glutamine methyltransferase [Klenkia soli]